MTEYNYKQRPNTPEWDANPFWEEAERKKKHEKLWAEALRENSHLLEGTDNKQGVSTDESKTVRNEAAK